MDIQNYYIEKGEGKALILLHGNGENSDYFISQIDFFSKIYRVIAPDTRGHGKTPRGQGEFTIRRFADDLYYLMDSLGIEKADILGFSDGANIAMCFAIKYPHRVDKLILNGGNLFPSGVKTLYQLPIDIEYIFAKLMSKKSKKALKKAELLSLMVNDPYLSAADLTNISADTLVIAGTNDMIKAKHTKLISDSIPGSLLKIIKGDHFIARDNPAEYNDVVLDFLSK